MYPSIYDECHDCVSECNIINDYIRKRITNLSMSDILKKIMNNLLIKKNIYENVSKKDSEKFGPDLEWHQKDWQIETYSISFFVTYRPFYVKWIVRRAIGVSISKIPSSNFCPCIYIVFADIPVSKHTSTTYSSSD